MNMVKIIQKTINKFLITAVLLLLVIILFVFFTQDNELPLGTQESTQPLTYFIIGTVPPLETSTEEPIIPDEEVPEDFGEPPPEAPWDFIFPPEEEPESTVFISAAECTEIQTLEGKEFWSNTSSITTIDNCADFAFTSCDLRNAFVQNFDYVSPNCCVWNCTPFG